jgi:hypothetical protein
MDAETRAVSERLRDGLTERGLWPECARLWLPVYDLLHGEALQLVLVAAYPKSDAAKCAKRFRDGQINPTLSTFPLSRLVPDLDAPGAWGVLFALLCAEMERGDPPRPYAGGVALSYAPCWAPASHRAACDPDTGVREPERFRQWGLMPGLALARALLAAWGHG